MRRDAWDAFERSRRQFLLRGASFALAGFLAAKARASEDPVAAATAALWRGCAEAAKRGAAHRLGEGVVTIYSVELPEGAILVGAPGKSTLRNAQGRPAILGRNVAKLEISSIIFDGGGVRPVNPSLGLLHFDGVAAFKLHGVTVRDAGGIGISNFRSGGEILGGAFERIGDAGYHSLDGLGVKIGADGDGNRIAGCGNAGVRIFTSRDWTHDGSLVRGNRISDIGAVGGGTGQNGNGVNIFRAGGVEVNDNVIERCAFSAIRDNGGLDFVARRNICSHLGERAFYAEFDFRNATFEDNRIDGAAAGVSLTNFDRERNVGRGGRVAGNRISGLVDAAPDPEWVANPIGNGARVGIEAEGDVEVVGNTVIGPARIGIACGFGAALRNVICEDNEIRGADYGIAFASAPPAGPARIAGNRIVDAKRARIVATKFGAVASGDLFGLESPYAPVTLGRNFTD